MSFFDELSEEASAVTRYTLRLALIVFLIGIAGGIGAALFNHSGGPVIFICSLVLALLVALFAIALSLFKVVQIRIPELMLVVAALGNAMGIGYRTVNATVAESVGGRGALVLMVALPCFVWALGGAAWGLWVAKELLIDAARTRLWLVFVGLLAPLAFLFAVAAIPLTGLALSNLKGGLAGLLILGFFISFAILMYATKLHLRVLKEIADSGDDDRL
jgi:hypothetical protein